MLYGLENTLGIPLQADNVKIYQNKEKSQHFTFKGTQTILRSSYQNLLTTTPKVLSQTVVREMGP